MVYIKLNRLSYISLSTYATPLKHLGLKCSQGDWDYTEHCSKCSIFITIYIVMLCGAVNV